MAKFKELIQWQTTSGQPVAAGNVTVTPQAWALTIRCPFGGLIWNRPLAVLVRRGEETKRIPIINITRSVQLGLLGLGLIFAVLAFVLTQSKRKGRNQHE